jgi:ubiquinone/menaquinone biosynthesis C-methylase UbiE
MSSDEFDSFFKQHALNVDNSNSLGFWKLTDEILLTYLLEQMPKRTGVTLVDFGGGTGRWVEMLDAYFADSNFIIVDLSKDMLAQAEKKLTAGSYTNNVQLINASISQKIDEITGDSVDYIISTYNPLSFVDKPQNVIDEAFRILKKGGVAQITVQGYYNALYSKINNSLADAEELEQIFSEKKVKWNPDVPKLWQLPKADMFKFFKTSGFHDIQARGIATLTQPQGEDFDPENNQLGSLSKKLNENKSFYNAVLHIELEAGRDQDAIDRAMNILTVGRKP